MTDKEEIYIKSFECETTEDDFICGEVGGMCSYWGSDTTMRIKEKDNHFKSVESALEYVCSEMNCFKFDKASWTNIGVDWSDELEAGRFDTDILVDNDNSEADESQIEKWKIGKMKLWNCHIIVNLGIRSLREFTMEELEKCGI